MLRQKLLDHIIEIKLVFLNALAVVSLALVSANSQRVNFIRSTFQNLKETLIQEISIITSRRPH